MEQQAGAAVELLEGDRALLVVPRVDARRVDLDDEVEVLEEAPDGVEREARMDVELVVADAEVPEVDHAAAQRRRVVDADERRVVAEPREVVHLGAVAEHPHVRRDRLGVQHLPGEGVGHEAHRVRDGAIVRSLEIDELDMAADVDGPARAHHGEVDRPCGLRARANQRERQRQAALVEIALQAVQRPDPIRGRRVLERLHEPAHVHRERIGRGAAERVERARVQVGVDARHGLSLGAHRAVGRTAEQRLEVGHEPGGLLEDAVEARARERRDVEDLVQQVRVDHVVGAEAGQRVGLGRPRGGPRAPGAQVGSAGGHDEVALEDAPGARQRLQERRFVVGEEEREAVREADAGHLPGLEAQVHARPAQRRHDVAQHALAEHLG